MTEGIKPLVIAHRGNSGPAPACTMEAIKPAVELGADMIELDVRISRDGVPVIIHNGTVDETTDGKGQVLSMTLAQLKKLDAGSWKDKRYAGQRHQSGRVPDHGAGSHLLRRRRLR